MVTFVKTFYSRNLKFSNNVLSKNCFSIQLHVTYPLCTWFIAFLKVILMVVSTTIYAISKILAWLHNSCKNEKILINWYLSKAIEHTVASWNECVGIVIVNINVTQNINADNCAVLTGVFLRKIIYLWLNLWISVILMSIFTYTLVKYIV